MPVQREGTDIILCLDFSNSMDAFDPSPGLTTSEVQEGIARGEIVDRLGVARQQIARFVKRRDGDRIGLVIFGVEAFLASPPTLDHDFLLAQVNQLDATLLRRAERGTNIAGGIAKSVTALLAENDTRRTIVLITDGDHTVEDKVFTPDTAAQAAKEKGIVIHSVGIGSDEPYKGGWLKDAAAIVRFDTRTLEKVSAITNGRFFRAKDNQGFEEVMDTIDSLETISRVHPALVFRRDLYSFLLIPGTLLLGTAFVLRKTLLLEIS
jgi:Ca-activated chloride channel family protein